MSDKTREIRLRRMAKRQGLEIRKSRRRDELALDYDRWVVVDPYTNTVVTGTEDTGRPNLTLDEVEEYLTTPRGER